MMGFFHGAVLNSILAGLFLFSMNTLAEPVALPLNGLRANGNLIAGEDKARSFFLIVHGTWAHADMELPKALQALLADEGYGSLAVTLSLGVDNRQAFLRCDSPVLQGQADALPEIHAWYSYLREQGYTRITLLGHSRGGAQAALYHQRYPQAELSALVLVAPMTWQARAIADDYEARFHTGLSVVLLEAEEALDRGREFFTPPGVLYCQNTQVKPEAFLSYYRENPPKNTPNLLSALAIPARVYLGSDDSLTASFLAQSTLYENNPKVIVKTVDGADHFFRDLYADEIVEDLLDSLK